MKKIIHAFLVISFLLISCKNDESIEEIEPSIVDQVIIEKEEEKKETFKKDTPLNLNILKELNIDDGDFKVSKNGETIIYNFIIKIDNEFKTGVKIFGFNLGIWSQKGEDLFFDDDRITSFDINKAGNRIIIGFGVKDIGDVDKMGEVLIYDYFNSQWNLQVNQELLIESKEKRIGQTVKINDEGDVIAVTSAKDVLDATVNIYKLLDKFWVLQKRITIIEKIRELRFELSGSGEILILNQGDSTSDVSRTVIQTYRNENGSWQPFSNAFSTTADFLDNSFEFEFAKNENFLAIGNKLEKNDPYKVSFLKYDGINWIKVRESLRSKYKNIGFGTSISISENFNRIAVSTSSFDSPNGTDSGLIQIFDYQNEKWVLKLSINGNDALTYLNEMELSANGEILIFREKEKLKIISLKNL